MAIESYILTKSVDAPYVKITGMPHRPQEVRFKRLQKGEIVKGELKHANNKPAFVLVAGVLVVPIDAVKKLVTKEIVSNVEAEKKESQPVKEVIAKTIPKLKYIDTIVIGAILGVGGAFLVEFLSKKNNWGLVADKKNKLYGAGIGAAVGVYLLYRFKPKTVVVKAKE